MISPERLLSLTSGKAAFATRGSVAKTPYFPETISCLAVIMGEIGDSGHNPGWDEDGKKTTIPNEFREGSLRAPRMEDQGVFRASFRHLAAFTNRGRNSSSIC